jgi:rhodanese-related sulfurtransferase
MLIRHALLPLLAILLLDGCRADLAGLETLSVAELVALRQAHGDLVVCDANTAKTRRDLGVVPGARLLSSYGDYDLAELGPDRAQALVFYCHSEMCGAAADAARRAIAGGYLNVSVLAPGIRGWRAAGQPVDHAPTEEIGS